MSRAEIGSEHQAVSAAARHWARLLTRSRTGTVHDDPFDHALKTTSPPRERSELCVRERTYRAVRAMQHNAHHLAGALLDCRRAPMTVEPCLGEALGDS